MLNLPLRPVGVMAEKQTGIVHSEQERRIAVALSGKNKSNAVEEFVRGLPVGAFFCSAGLAGMASSRTIQRTLRRLTDNDVVMRCMRGVYYRPGIVSCSWMKTKPFAASPSYEEVLRFYGSLTGEIIGMHGAVACNGTGISPDVPMRAIFHTTGRSRMVSVFGKRTLLLVHINARCMRLSDHPVHPVLMALLWRGRTKWGRQYVDMEMMEYFHRKLSKENFAFLNSRRDAMPLWLSKKFDMYLGSPRYALNDGPGRLPPTPRFRRSDDDDLKFL